MPEFRIVNLFTLNLAGNRKTRFFAPTMLNMDISIYFEPLELESSIVSGDPEGKLIGDKVSAHTPQGGFPDLDDIEIAIIGIKEDRNAVANAGCGEGPDYIRHEFYQLFPGNYPMKLADLGNIPRGHTISDTYFALTAVVAELVSRDIVPIILGGSQDLTYAAYKAYEKIGRIINIVAVDPSFDIGHTEDDIDSRSYLSKIILSQPNYLFNYTNIGYQSYFVDREAVNLMDNLFFDCYRLGMVQSNIEEVEPMVRNADMMSIDITAVRMSDAPGNNNSIPNGFYGEELCRITRYAGVSDKLSSIGFYEYNPRHDLRRQTAMLISQMMWYFIDGFYHRSADQPRDAEKDYIRFTVTTDDFKDEILFYKSKKSERWWMKVPVRLKIKSRYERHHMVPCSYADYQAACDNMIPDRWWQTYQKLM